MRQLPFILALFLSNTTLIFAQSEHTYYPTPSHPELFKYVPLVDENTPDWARLMYADSPNVYEVDRLYRAYYQAFPFQKSIHTQNYKHWRRLIQQQHYLQADGQIVVPTETEQRDRIKQYRSQLTLHKNAMANWEPLGPFDTKMEGGQTSVSWQANIYVFDQSISNPDILYCGTETGGVFKSLDKGLSWFSIGDDLILGGIGSIKVSPVDPDIVLLAQGNNVFQSLDGGDTWAIVLSQSGLTITDISINPENPEVILLAGSGGLFRSSNGGIDWTQLYNDRCWDIEIKPDDPSVVYVLKNNPSRKVCEFFKSEDMGATFSIREMGWYNPSPNLPNQSDGGARMTVTPADPNRVYCALLGNEVSYTQDVNWVGVYRSNDAGESWSLPAGEPGGPYSSNHWCLSSFSPTFAWGGNYDQGYYNLGIAASHTNPDAFLVGCLNLFKTSNGGTTYEHWGGYGGGPGNQHPDIQDIDILGTDVWVSSDGGINYYTNDFNSHESRINGINSSEFWGFGSGWNEDVLVGGRYHNGNTSFYQNYPYGQFLRLGGAESPTGYVNQGMNRRVHFDDIGGRLIPEAFEGMVTSIPDLSLYPSQSYFNESKSEIAVDPRCYNHLYLGNENILYKSEDGGQRFAAIGVFGTNPDHRVVGIEVSRSNPEVIYVAQRINGQSALWKTEDSGNNWQQLSLPAAGASGGGIFITLSPVNKNELWIAYGNGGSNNNKVFTTTDGGTNWTNLTTTMLDGHYVEDIHVHGGTNGGVYLATDLAVFYRNHDLGDWELFNQGAPQKLATLNIRPFYRDGKIRVATYNRGIWESDFYEPSMPIVQPSVDKRTAFCSRDTFYFSDYSILNHNGASWEWSFPGAQWVDGADTYQPKVVYGSPGVYDVTLAVTVDGNTYEKTETAMIEIVDECAPEIYPGNALELTSTDGSDYAVTEALNLNSNTVTFSAWIKRFGDQPSFAGLLFTRGGTTTVGFNFGENNELRYHWDDGEWWWDSGQVVPDQEWTHVALVIEPDRATIYLNGVGAVNNANHVPELFEGAFLIGKDPNFDSRQFRGMIDEVCIWNKALTEAEIRATMHLTKKPEDDPDLALYYQFNRPDGTITDRIGNRHASATGNAQRRISTGPFGGGTSQEIAVSEAGLYNFENADLALTFPENGVYPDGPVVVSHIIVDPDQQPGPNSVPDAGYWVVNNYGTNTSFSPLDQIRFTGFENLPTDGTQSYELFDRPFNAEGNSWSPALDQADLLTDSTITFGDDNGVSTFGQFVMQSTEVTAVQQETPNHQAYLFPNPAKAGHPIWVALGESTDARVDLWTVDGQHVASEVITGNRVLGQVSLKAGLYVYKIETAEGINVGKLTVFD